MFETKSSLRPNRSIASEAIGLQSVSKSFPAAHGRRVEVLRDVSLQVRSGEIMGVMGSNGAGKTTLLEILATTQLPTSGIGAVGGYDLVAQAPSVKRLVGYCASNADSFYPRLTGRANLQFFGALKNLSPRDVDSQVRSILELIGAPELADTLFQRCSTGMKQKLGLARALLSDPPVLLFDEPTRSLDPSAQRGFQDLVRKQLVDTLGKTVLLVTHNLEEARRICDRVALLEDGMIAGISNASNVPSEWMSDRRQLNPAKRRA